ncbi:MAG: protein kinase [Chloroflexota bacterium]
MNEDPLIGQTIGNYSIESLLGHGGMAQVYFGQDIKLQRPVAIKVIDPRYRGKTAQARRFIKEARVMAKWKHENIVQIYSADDEGDLYYYVMEYVDGKDLASILSSYAADGELIPIADVVRIGRAIANALDYAHKQGVIHRDVKPSNVLVALDGRVMLSDFGLALDLADGSLGEVFGTAHYISPEQARRSADAVPQSDIYSLGVILYEMLAGSVPFTDPSPASVALHHISDAPPAPRLRNPEIHPAVETVLLKALEKESANRYQSGAELMDALEAAFAQPKQSTGLTLPPIPIGVPTIRRRALSRSSVADRVTGRVPENAEPTVRSAGTVQRELSSRVKPKWRTVGLVALTLLGLLAAALAWNFRFSLFDNLPGAASPTFTALPTLPSPTTTSAPLPTQSPTDTPLPTLSFTPAPTATLAVEPLFTLTLPPTPITRTASPTSALPTASPGSATATSTVAFPNGNLFQMLYNDNSFFIINKSTVTRSVSGFIFERLDLQGNVLATFHGWRWERYYPNLGPKRCMAIYIVESPPYLDPTECNNTYASVLNYERDAEIIFWTRRENSAQFRVLWQNTEAGRCEIAAGTCEVRVP